MKAIRIPSLAENVNEATVSAWLVTEGDTVAKGQPVAHLITEKADFELESDHDGTLSRILAPAKSVMPVGGILAVLDAKIMEIKIAEFENEQAMKRFLTTDTVQLEVYEEEDLPVSTDDTTVVIARPNSDRVRATPAARRLAKENNLDLAAIAAARELEGMVREEDVRRYLESQ